MKALCISHKDCLDGLFAADMVLRNETNITKEDVFFFDHSPSISQVEETGFTKHFVKQFEKSKTVKLWVVDYYLSYETVSYLLSLVPNNCRLKVMWIDHHKTAMEHYSKEYELFLELSRGGSFEFTYYFNLECSAARLVWKFFYEDKENKLVDYVEDRDLFLNKFQPETNHFRFGFLNLYPKSTEILGCNLDYEELVSRSLALGKPLFEQYDSYVKRIASQATDKEVVLEDGKVIKAKLVSCTEEFTSDVGAALYNEETPLAIMYTRINKGVWKVGLRSHPSVDCSVIAKRYCGGGHPCASACRMDDETFFKFLTE